MCKTCPIVLTKAAVREHTILVASTDPNLSDVRKHLLEGAGYKVIPAMDLPTIREACRTRNVSLVVIGESMPPAEKRRVWVEARKSCKTPILQLYQGGEHELAQSAALFFHESHTPCDLLAAVDHILKKRAS